MSSRDLVSTLKLVGLTEYEARAFVSLTTIGAGSPRRVASLSRIPYPSAYDALNSLVSKGWAEVASTRPVIYRARPPSLVKKELHGRIETTFTQLQKIYESQQESAPEIVYTIRGKERVISKMTEMLDGAKRAIMVVAASRFFSEESLRKSAEQAIERRAKVRIITEESMQAKPPVGAEVRFRESVLAVDLLVDDEQALIGLPDYSACGWVDSPIIASHFQEFLELLWKQSREAQPRRS